ncbi:hypothetical protein ACF06X_14765 [Streptomyces sp. NPDC015346]|uniref:hypothetical protein n=1 Tax=Streptomyces sp. NPDC015346 TaxID=3364954 RepID=UPI0037026693
MFGAGVASADNASSYGSGIAADPALCHQEAHHGTVNNGLINVADLGLGLLLGSGEGSSGGQSQQICANGPVLPANGAEASANENEFAFDVL